MLHLRWILITLIVILNTISVKAFETGKESSQSVSPPTKAPKPIQSQKPELEKKREAFEPETEKKKGMGDVEQHHHFLVVESQYHVKVNLDKYIINTDEKYVYSRIQVAIEGLNKIINELDRCLRPDTNLADRKGILHSVFFYRLSRDLNTIPVLHSFVQGIENNFKKGISEEKPSNRNTYSVVYVQLIEYCTKLRSMLEEKLKTTQKDKLEDSDIKSTLDRLIENDALLDPKLVAEQLYKCLKSLSTVENQFSGVTGFFETAKLILEKFWTRLLDVRFWTESSETHKAQLEIYLDEYHIKWAFKFILNILTGAITRSSELGIPIVKCAEVLEPYMNQIENAFWHFYAPEITDFNAHYSLNPKQIAEEAVTFIKSCPNKERAMAVVKEFVIVRPSAFFRMAFKDGAMNQETLESLNSSIELLHGLLWKEYSGEGKSSYIIVIYNRFLHRLVDDLVDMENQGIKVDLNALLNSIELQLQIIWAIISAKLAGI